jgi:hypothetical protein
VRLNELPEGKKPATKRAFWRAITNRFPKVPSLHRLRTDPELEILRDAVTQLFYLRDNLAIFSSPRQLEMLGRSAVLVADGTFGYAPRGVYQIYRVFGFVEGRRIFL